MHLASLTRLLRWPGLVMLALGVAAPAPACTIPVFRYALERWELSPYEVVVFHRGELSANTRRFLNELPGKVNLVVNPVDINGKLSPALQTLWQQQGNPPMPWVVMRRTDAGAKAPPAWTGPYDAGQLRQLVDSPARQTIIAALSKGSSGVFVLLLSGDHAADEAARTLMQDQLAKLEKLVKLPEQRGEGPRIRLALPLKVSFTLLPLKRSEPGEAAFVHLLLGSEDDLIKVRGPILFPIFGRGRLLGSLYGKDVNAETLFDVVSFLCGECSCQVKELNPGMDLPISADWPALFERIGPASESGPDAPLGATRMGGRVKPAPEASVLFAGTSKPGAAEAGAVRAHVSYYPPEAQQPVAPIEPAPGPMPPIVASDVPAVAIYRRYLWVATLAAAVLVVLTGAWAWTQWFRTRRPYDAP